MGNTFFKRFLPIIRRNPLESRKSIERTRESFYNFHQKSCASLRFLAESGACARLQEEFRKRPLSFSSQRRNSTPNWTRNSSISNGNFPIYMPKNVYANIQLFQNCNLKISTKEKKLLPFFVPKTLAPPLPVPPLNISSLGLNLTEHGKTFSNVGTINKSNFSRSSINIIPLPETKSKAHPNSPLLLSGAQKKKIKRKQKSN